MPFDQDVILLLYEAKGWSKQNKMLNKISQMYYEANSHG